MYNYARSKGNKGHQLTKEYLENKEWSVWIKPHQETTYRGQGTYEWRHIGSNDIFAIPDKNNPHKKRGGFDILAIKYKKPLKTIEDQKEVQLYNTCAVCSFWQVKKTKKNPITPALKKEIQECADYYKIPRSSCYIIWWPEGVGIKRGEPKIWRADEDESNSYI